MQTISLNVSPSIAKAFEWADERLKKKAENSANILFENVLNRAAYQDKLEDILKKGAPEEKSNGFTTDMLEDLLNEDE